MLSRLKLVVAYDGRPFAGWQSQKNGNGVQDHLERALALVLGDPIRVHGAGRTDAGVHALAQTAHIDVPDRSLDEEEWTGALNSSLPATIRVLRCNYVAKTFHARFSAKGKLYRYRIWNDRILPPLEVGRAWYVPSPLQFETMKAEAPAFLGRHDFASFAANRGQIEEDTFRTIEQIALRKQGHCITCEVSGDGFLYKMVRLMVGALVRAGRDPAKAGEIRARLESPAQTSGSARLSAAADGLYLVRVRY